MGGSEAPRGLGCNPSKSLAVAQIRRCTFSPWSEQRLHRFQLQEREIIEHQAQMKDTRGHAHLALEYSKDVKNGALGGVY